MEYFNCTSFAYQPCCASAPGFLGQSSNLPGNYGQSGFCGAFGKLSNNVFRDSCACAAPCPVPFECIRCPLLYCCSNDADHLCMKGYLAPRCEMTDVYRNGEYMNESYAGHVPGFSCNCVESNQGRSVLGTKIFLNNAGFYNEKIPYRNTLSNSKNWSNQAPTTKQNKEQS